MPITKWRSAGRVFLFYALCVALLIFTSKLAHPLQGLASLVFIGGIGAVFVWTSSWAFVRWDEATLASIGARLRPGSAWKFFAGFALGLSLVGAHALLLHFAGHASFVRNDAAQWQQIMLAFVGYSLLASREELAFHGYPLRRLSIFWGPSRALGAVTLVFTLEHVAGGADWFSAILGAGVGSILFGTGSLATRGLAVPIGMHAAWNFGDWLRSSGGKIAGGPWIQSIEPGYEGRAAIVGWAGYVTLALAVVAGFWWWDRRRGQSGSP